MSGIEKTNWRSVKNLVEKIDPIFSNLVEEISPGDDFPLYIASYNYGENIGDHLGTILRNEKGELYRLGDEKTPADILKNLGYGVKNAPLTITLDKQFEWYVSDKKNNTSFPVYIEKPGFFIGVRQLLNSKKANTYISSSIMSCTAGAKSAFTLSNIGNQRNHLYLQRKLGITHAPPKEMQQHWNVFKEICAFDKEWEARTILFSENWVKNLKTNPKWVYIQKYLIEKMVKSWEQDKNYFFYNYAFSKAHIEKNMIKNPYLNETAKHVLGIPLNTNLGFQPCNDEQSLPLKTLQNAYKNIYQLKENPIFLEPTKFDMNSSNQLPVYYSLQKPIICSLEKQTKTEPRALANIHTLYSMIKKYTEAFCGDNEMNYFAGTSLQEISKNIQFTFMHHDPDDTDIIKSASVIKDLDQRFSKSPKNENLDFSSDARFFRGCVMINRK